MDSKYFHSHSSAFSLFELMIIVAIVGFLAAIGMTTYNKNIIESKANSMWQEAEAAKLFVETQYLKNGTDVSTITVDSGTANYASPSTDFVKCVTIQSGIVSVVGNSSAFGGLTMWVSWEPSVASGTLTWSCHYSSDMTNYMPNTLNSCSTGTAAYAGDPSC